MESESVALPPTRVDLQARDGSPALPPPPPANLRGFLKKQGPGFSSKWQLRWFEQKGNRLYYYKPSSLSFSITSADLGDADAGDLDLTIDDNDNSNPSSPSMSSPRATSPPTRSLSEPRFRKSGGGINVSSGRGMKEIAESDKKKQKKEKKEKKNKIKKEENGAGKADGDDSDDVGDDENGNHADGGGGGDDDGDEEQPPMPNPRGFIELRKVSAIAGRANDINAAKNLEKYHFYFDLYTAERVFRLAASTEEHYLYWNEGLKRWKRHTSSLLPPLQLTPPLSASPGIPSSFGSDTSTSSSSSSPSFSSSSSSSSPSSSLSTSSSSLSVGLLAPSPNSPLYSPFSLALPPQPTASSSSLSSSLSPMSSPAVQRLADLSLDARDEPDWTRKNTKFGYTSMREDRASSHRRGLGLGSMGSGRPLAAAEDKQLRRGRSVRSTRDFMLRTQPLPSSASALSSASMPSLPLLAPAASDDRSRELLLEREKDLQELLALKGKEIAQLKEELARESRQAEVEPARASNSSDAVLTQRKATNFIGTRGGPAPMPTTPTPTPDAAALRIASEAARRLADELARERSEGLQWRIAAKETELALKQELLEREMVIKHLHFVIDDLDKQQQQQQQDVDNANNSGDVDTVATVDEPVAAAAAVVDSVDDSMVAAAAVAATGKEWGRESRRREKKEEKEEREREKREQREQREREKREHRASLGGSGSGSGKAGRKKESKATYEEARRQLEQERKEHRLASNFLRSQCELLEAQKVAAEESFAQLRQTLEKEIVDARTRCLELERLRLAPEEVGDSRLGHLRHHTGPAALSHRPSADAGAD